MGRAVSSRRPAHGDAHVSARAPSQPSRGEPAHRPSGAIKRNQTGKLCPANEVSALSPEFIFISEATPTARDREPNSRERGEQNKPCQSNPAASPTRNPLKAGNSLCGIIVSRCGRRQRSGASSPSDCEVVIILMAEPLDAADGRTPCRAVHACRGCCFYCWPACPRLPAPGSPLRRENQRA